jgi:transposase-like protein
MSSRSLGAVTHRSLKSPATSESASPVCETWLAKADVEDGVKPGVTSAEVAELREARKKIRLLEQEHEVLRRAAAHLSQANLNLGQSPK